MDNNISQRQEYSIRNAPGKLFTIVLIIILLFAVSAFSYMLGKDSVVEDVDSSKAPLDIAGEKIVDTKKPVPTESLTSVSPTQADLKTKTIVSTPDLDGYRSSNNSGNNSQEIIVGRNLSFVARGFLSFELKDIPPDANISEVLLRIYQVKMTGNPYTAGRDLRVDHLTYGDNLDTSDYGIPALYSNFNSLPRGERNPHWKEADVTEKVKGDIANARGTSQFRIHFQRETTGGDETGDFVHLESSENSLGSNNPPELLLKYY